MPVGLSAIAGLRNVWPVAIVVDGLGHLRAPVMTQEFRADNHHGVDIMFLARPEDPTDPKDPRRADHFYVPVGARIIAAAPGFVKYAYQHENGWRVRLIHDSGFDTCYFHMSELHKTFTVGELVNVGDVLGDMGGDPTQADPHHTVHLHFEIRRNDGGAGVPIDPMNLGSLPGWGRLLLR